MKHFNKQRGGSSILAVFFVSLFSVLAISFTSMTNVNVQMAKNHHDMSAAQAASESGLEYARLLVNTYTPPPAAQSANKDVSQSEAEATFDFFYDHVSDYLNGASILSGEGISYDSDLYFIQIPATGNVNTIAGTDNGFSLEFTFQAGGVGENHLLIATSTGTAGDIQRQTRISFPIKKESDVLEYAIASRGRIWVTGDTTVEGDVFSDYDNLARAPFNTTSETDINGTINTVMSHTDVGNSSWQMETWDENGEAMFDENGDRIYSSDDEVQGEHEGINYDQYSGVPGMDISDYNTDLYNNSLTNISNTSNIQVEYFPHASGNYNYPRDGSPSSTWNRRLERRVYENQHFSNVRLPDNYNALFINCTFDDVLYIDVYKSGSSRYNNVRFEDCTFNGMIVTDVPQQFKWRHNALYFTGSATFQNNFSEEATILAPHFNVNLGNSNSTAGETNQLTGAIVGGIVDVRGNANIEGTIISMADTTMYTSGYVTNIGATLNDGGSETTTIDDVGTIIIEPEPDRKLPSGITTPIVIGSADGNSYVEL